MAKQSDHSREPGPTRTRSAILDLLKRDGPQDAKTLADVLGVSAMAVRQHLYDLDAQKLVDFTEQARAVGRPAKLWRLTDQANRFFPDGHAELAAGLIAAMTQAFGDKGMEKMLALRGEQLTQAYRTRVTAAAPLKKRLAALAKLRSEEGYMAEVRAEDDGSYLLLEHHCPICVAAKACSGLCQVELEVFRAVLGDDVRIERSDHILAGAPRCAYRVTSNS